MVNRIIIFFVVFAVAGCATSGKKFRYVFQDEISQMRESVNRGSLEQAIRDLSMLLEMDPANKDARYLRAVAYQKKGQDEKAAQDYLLLLEHHPDDSKSQYNLAMIYAFKLTDKKAALRYFDNFLTLEPRHPEAFNTAKIMCTLDRSYQTLRADSISDSRRIDLFYADWGLKSALEEKNLEKRKKMILGAVDLDPSQPEPYFAMAKTSEEEGNYTDAIKYYKKAIEAGPTFADAHYNLGQLLLKEGKKDEAEVHLIKASLFQPNDPR